MTSWLVDLYRSALHADGLDFALSVDSRKVQQEWLQCVRVCK